MSLPSLPPASTLSPEAALDELGAYLRPPGQGIHTVSTGRAELLAKTRRYLGDGYDPDAPWSDHLRGLLATTATCSSNGQ